MRPPSYIGSAAGTKRRRHPTSNRVISGSHWFSGCADVIQHKVIPATPISNTVLAILALVVIVAGFDTSMVYAALAAIIRDVGNSRNASWIITSYFIVAPPAAACFGRLGDMYGRRRLLIVALITACIGSIVSAVATDFAPIVIGRALQGVLVATIPLSYGILRDNIPTEKIAVGVGVLGAAAAFGTLGGLLVGGLIVDHFRWPNIFFAGFAGSFAAMVAVAFCVP